MNGAEIIATCRQIAKFSEEPGKITRTFLSPPMRDLHGFLREWMERLGIEVKVDAAGNMRGTYPGSQSQDKLVIASHIDTVPDAGAFDGVLGVVLGISLIGALQGRRMPYAIEVVAFSEEEGVRFGVPFIGSRAFIGAIDEALLKAPDQDGVMVEQAITDFGLDPSQIREAEEKNAFAYLEFHIEQGPVLDELGLGLGLVDAIVGQTRLEVVFCGTANHAGTTPMRARRDALAGAAEWVLAVENYAKGTPGFVATVGQIQAKPGAPNVIPGEAVLSLDARHAGDEARAQFVKQFLEEAARIAEKRGLTISHTAKLDQPAVPMDSRLQSMLEDAFKRTGLAPHRMPSGAGHDAMIVASKIPSAMVFLRSPEGLSHNPDESVYPEDVESALRVGLAFLDKLP